MRDFKKLQIFILLGVIPLFGYSQGSYVPGGGINQYHIWFEHLVENEVAAVQYAVKDLDLFIDELGRKQARYKDPESFLKYVYYKVHRKYLRHYQSPSTLDDLLQNKNYDCVTGTALYAIIFEQLAIPYDIIETTFHIYLTVNIDNHLVVFESTSPLDGFITDQEIVRTAQLNYQLDAGGSDWTNKEYYKPTQAVSNNIVLSELAGLQYFNQAVAFYNQYDLASALNSLSNALQYYPSDRLKEMMVIMINTLEKDEDIDPLLKRDYLSKYNYLRHSIITAYREN